MVNESLQEDVKLAPELEIAMQKARLIEYPKRLKELHKRSKSLYKSVQAAKFTYSAIARQIEYEIVVSYIAVLESNLKYITGEYQAYIDRLKLGVSQN